MKDIACRDTEANSRCLTIEGRKLELKLPLRSREQPNPAGAKIQIGQFYPDLQSSAQYNGGLSKIVLWKEGHRLPAPGAQSSC